MNTETILALIGVAALVAAAIALFAKRRPPGGGSTPGAPNLQVTHRKAA